LVERGIVLVAEQAGKLCGFISAQIIAGEWEIENVVVAPESLGRGIASDLMEALIKRAREERALAMMLEVRESNLPARRLYEKHGFREVGRRRLYYQVPEEDAILYTLQFEL
jgi:[ribosomal protein S18]-alanine N-acetyltransferase